ncbi:hypothetical protein ACWGNE_02370 [Streptomyces xiamenensis]
MMYAIVIVQRPDGTQSTYHGPGAAIGTVSEQEARASAETYALAAEPAGTYVVNSTVIGA